MSGVNSGKYCAILLGMGGPDELKDIPEFLYNIFSDRNIINLPGGRLFQKPFAKFISRMRSSKVMEHYRLIGGGSPLLKWTEYQRQFIESELSEKMPGFKCFIGMRYFRPTIEQAISDALIEGFSGICFLPLYPQYCLATTGSSFREANKVLKHHNNLRSIFINDFHDQPSFVELLKDYINTNLGADEFLLFSAHSIPRKLMDKGDPYVEQIKKTAELVSGDREYLVSFQSRTGPVKWVGPDTVDEVKRLVIDENQNVFIVPLSFLCDHIETLFEIDIDLKRRVGASGAKKIVRMPMFNDDNRLGSVLAEIIFRRITDDAA